MPYKMSRYPSDRKIFIGDLPKHARIEEIEDVCSEYGRVRDVWVARNPPGFGFVEFEDARDAGDAVRGLNGRRVCGRRAIVELSTKRSGRGRPYHNDDKCYECGDRGHNARECRERRYKRSRRERSYSRDRSPSYRRNRSRSASPVRNRYVRRSSSPHPRAPPPAKRYSRSRSPDYEKRSSRSRSSSGGRRPVRPRDTRRYPSNSKDTRIESTSRGGGRQASRRSYSKSRSISSDRLSPRRSPRRSPKQSPKRRRSESQSPRNGKCDEDRSNRSRSRSHSKKRGTTPKEGGWD